MGPLHAFLYEFLHLFPSERYNACWYCKNDKHIIRHVGGTIAPSCSSSEIRKLEEWFNKSKEFMTFNDRIHDDSDCFREQYPIGDWVSLVPIEISVFIFSFLDSRDLSRCCLVSPCWKAVAEHPSLWENQCLHVFGKMPVNACVSQKEIFRQLKLERRIINQFVFSGLEFIVDSCSQTIICGSTKGHGSCFSCVCFETGQSIIVACTQSPNSTEFYQMTESLARHLDVLEHDSEY